MSKEQRYDWNKLKKEFQDKLKKITPDDLTNYTSLINSEGYCAFCQQKKVLFFHRGSKRMYCSDCRPVRRYEFTAIEYNNMWELAQEILFYADEAIKEMKK